MRVSGLDTRVSSLETSFPAGCNTIMQAVTAKGQTPASNSPSDIVTAINNISSGNIDFVSGIHASPSYASSNSGYKFLSKVDYNKIKNKTAVLILSLSETIANNGINFITVLFGNNQYTYLTFDMNQNGSGSSYAVYYNPINVNNNFEVIVSNYGMRETSSSSIKSQQYGYCIRMKQTCSLNITVITSQYYQSTYSPDGYSFGSKTEQFSKGYYVNISFTYGNLSLNQVSSSNNLHNCHVYIELV